jgi:dolichol-phosphate mannosyltransferase
MTEDVALIRRLIESGWRIGMRDASRLLVVDMHDSGREAWREWGRSLALPGVASGREQIVDILTLSLTMVAPLAIVATGPWHARWWLLIPAVILLAARWMFHVALRPTYDHPRWTYWLAPLTDVFAVLRMTISAVRPNRNWRGRSYARSG